MPQTFPNAYNYTSPIGNALANMTQTLLSGPTQAQRITMAEQALALKRQREGITSVADLFGQYGTPGFDRNAAMKEAVLGGMQPQQLSDLERYGAANTYGATDPRSDNAYVGAGGAYGSTAGGFNATLGETTRNNKQQSADRNYATDVNAGTDLFKFNNTPKEATVNGVPQYVPNSGAFAPGVAPILSGDQTKTALVAKNWDNLDAFTPTQRQYAIGNPNYPTISNYLAPDGTMHVTYDGRTDAQTGAPLAPGGSTIGQNNPNLVSPTVRSNLQSQTIANANLGTTINSIRDAVTNAPDVNFGATGLAKTVAQNATILATNVATGLGFSAPEDALAAVQKQAAAAGLSQDVLSGIFDPRLGAMETSYGLLVYQVAGALAGQQGRGISDADVKRAQSMVGDPTGLLSNKQTLLSKLDALQTQLNINQGTVNNYLSSPTLNGKPPPAAPPLSGGSITTPGQQGSAQPSSFTPGAVNPPAQKSAKGGANAAYAGDYWGTPGDPNFEKDHLATIKSASGVPFTVNKVSASAFQGFINELEGMGYKLNPTADDASSYGGYNPRSNINGKPSQHAYGNAIDINPAENPASGGRYGGDGQVHTNLPPNISDIAAKYGLSWGGDWNSLKDPMHFEFMGGDGGASAPPAGGQSAEYWKGKTYNSPNAPGFNSQAPTVYRDQFGEMSVPDSNDAPPGSFATSGAPPIVPPVGREGAQSGAWQPGGAAKATVTHSPKGAVVPKSWLDRNRGDADLWDYLSADQQAEWIAAWGT